MRKSGDQEISSLDMLLDTMCNTFGGIVFIALLISILSSSLRKQSEQAEQDTTETVAQVDRNIEINRLSREQQELMAAVRHWEAVLVKSAQASGPSGAELGVLVASNETLSCALEALRQTNAALTVASVAAEESSKRDPATEADLRAQIDQLTENIQMKRQQSVRSVRLPRIHSVAGKIPVFVMIKDGKYYAVTAVPQRRPVLHNTDYDLGDVTVEKGSGMDVVEARKTAGQPIVADCERRGKFAQALTLLDPSRQFVSFAVYTNSFAQFNYVKTLFVSKGFEYNWIVSDGALQIVETSEPHVAQ